MRTSVATMLKLIKDFVQKTILMMDALNILSLIIGIVGLFYAFYATRQFSRGVKIGSLLYIRTMINRMEEGKQSHDRNSPQWNVMHHTQQDLDALFRNLQSQFGISDKESPLT